MDLPEVVSVRKFKELSVKQKEDVYDTLMELALVLEDIPKKSLRKTLDLTLAVLQHKGEQIKDLEDQLDEKEEGSLESHRDRLVDENEKLKRMLGDLEDEKQEYKHKIKELTEEMFALQRRLHEAANAEGSDRDSSDPLSELDKQETLLRSINTKNKHIKRLLREIESLQNQNIEQSKTILTLDKDAQHAKDMLLQCKADLALLQSEKKAHQETIQELNVEIKRLEGNVTYLEDEREKSERDVKEFIDKLEKKAILWKKLMEEKDKQLRKLQSRSLKPDDTEEESNNSSETKTNSENFDEQEERAKMLHALETRDQHIEQLEFKIKSMAEEMIASTKLMNKITTEREHERNPQNPRSCCKTIEAALKASNQKCCELSEMLQKAEEEAGLKAKQALDACSALSSFQKGEDGLVKALKKCSTLESKLQSRDKEIHSLVVELNSLHEIAQENVILRRRLNLPDDVVITTKNLSAKERSKEKMIEKLTLKLRASEEMRLQLKMEKCDLRKELFDLQQRLNVSSDNLIASESFCKPSPKSPAKPHSPTYVQEPKNTPEHKNSFSRRSNKEIGEVEDSSNSAEASLTVTACSQCQGNLRIELQDSGQMERSDDYNYQEALQENEILRQGMLEILEKLREYAGCSDNIIISDALLLRLIKSLKISSSLQSSPTKLRREQLKELQHRDSAIREYLNRQTEQTDTSPDKNSETDEINSIESVREAGEIKDIKEEEILLDVPQYLDSSTRPTSPNKSINIPSIQTPRETLTVTEKRQNEMDNVDLKVYKKYYEELRLHMNASEIELMQICSKQTEQIVQLETNLEKESKSFLYMKEDFDKNLTDLKTQELRHIEREANLKLEISQLKEAIEKIQHELDYNKTNYIYSKDEYQHLEKSLQECQMQMALLTEEILKGKHNAEFKIPEMCLDYGIIQEDLQLSFISQQEFEKQQQIATEFEVQKLELQRRITQLESLLEIAQDQIVSQQRLLNDITDNHINLRHLVADLQSTTEEKLLLAKIQRDLDTAKSEVSYLKEERNTIKQTMDSLQMDLQTCHFSQQELTRNFQTERQNYLLKIKFLQKSLNCLREKYAKFTPLVFLTNFVFAYNKFLQKSLTNTSSKDSKEQENLQQHIEDTVKAVIKTKSEQLEDSEQLIKLIKTETQCKLYEDQIQQLEKKCLDLEKDLHAIKLKMATENEHWHTIEALFAQDKITELQNTESLITNVQSKKIETEMKTKEMGCNTENMELTPVPAARKLSANGSKRKQSIEMVDKNLSPLQSPLRKGRKTITTQTENKNGNGKETTDTGNALTKVLENELNKNENENVAQNSNKNAEVIEKARKPENKGDPLDKENMHVLAENSTKSSVVTNTAAKKTLEVEVQTLSSTMSSESRFVQTVEEQVNNARESPKSNSNEPKLNEALIKLQKTEESLSMANQKIQDLEKQMATVKESHQHSNNEQTMPSLQSDVIEKTILSFHTLLSEKDKSIAKYQDLLQSEREQSHLNATKIHAEMEGLKSTITNLNFNIKTKDIEILELKTQLEVVTVRRNGNEKLALATATVTAGDENVDNSLNEMSDEKIEQLFEENSIPSANGSPVKVLTAGLAATEKHELEDVKDIPENVVRQLRELKEKASYWESCLKVKDGELTIVKEKIRYLEEREKSLTQPNSSEIEQFRLLLEEKDKHINELMDTLNNFHDDQRRYINDSSNYSADQIAKLAANLTRTEATNKIYQTQMEALRKQLINITHREKQARDLNQSLRQQLLKRPVVSIKSELNSRVKCENLQKRVQQLELDLEDARAEIQRQKVIIDGKRARSANEVGLWEKQKRWQQNAEKFKAKLEETEIMLEKTRSLLQAARTTINRLEKDKQILEAKLGRVTQHNVQNAMKCCRTPSCPNLHHQSSSGPTRGGTKYTPSESPETYTGASSECSSPGRSAHVQQNHHAEIIEALKARIEMQQRKILAMELEGKGSNALTTEMEKVQEKLSSVEAQNIRLEARNLQLQLDNDLMRQGDGTERLQKRIKHLEDYIIALKEEMATTEARRELCKCSGIKLNIQSGQSAEHTILSLRNLVEKLKAENKYLKDGRRSCESRTSTETSHDSTRLQQMYSESLDKIAALQLELKLQTKCPHCENKNKQRDNTTLQDELCYVKEQLIKKTQLLDKAKVLLTRAAAKEKILKEQVSLWKRKCSELQNVPVIDEISE